MSDITNSGFLTKLAAANTSVSAIFTSSGTMTAGISPTDVLFAVTTAYRDEQAEVNAAITAPPYLNTVSPFAGQAVLFDADGNAYQDTVATVRIRKELTINNISAAESTVRL